MGLLTRAELATWIREDVEDTAFADLIIEAASEAVKSAARQPTWTLTGLTAAPVRARLIAGHLAARTYLNPDSIQAEGGIGPIGGDRYVTELAMALHLTDTERAELDAMAPTTARGGLWIQPVVPAAATSTGTIHLHDNSGSDWHIPYLDPNDLPALG